MEEKDLDITPFYKSLLRYAIEHIAQFLLGMALVALGAWAAFCYLSEEERKSDGDSRSDD